MSAGKKPGVQKKESLVLAPHRIPTNIQSVFTCSYCPSAVYSSVGQTQLLARWTYHQCWRVRVQFLSGTLDFILSD